MASAMALSVPAAACAFDVAPRKFAVGAGSFLRRELVCGRENASDACARGAPPFAQLAPPPCASLRKLGPKSLRVCEPKRRVLSKRHGFQYARYVWARASSGSVTPTHSPPRDMRVVLCLALAARTTRALLAARTYANAAFEGAPVVDTTAGLDHATLPRPANATDWTAEFVGTLSLASVDAASRFTVNCSFGGARAALVWIDDHLVCQTGLYDVEPEDAGRVDGSPENPLRRLRRTDVVVRARLWLDADDLDGFSVQWTMDDAAATPIPSSLLTETISADESAREALQRNLSKGWGLWDHNDLFDFLLLPEAAALKFALCNSTDCYETAVVKPDLYVKPGALAYDRSFGTYEVAWGGARINVTFGASLDLLEIVIDALAAPPGASARPSGNLVRWSLKEGRRQRANAAKVTRRRTPPACRRPQHPSFMERWVRA